MFISSHTKRLLFVLLFIIIPLSCKNDRYIFPYVHVDIYALLANLDAKIGPNESAFMYNDAGLNGLIIYRSLYNGYFVFDRTCTYEPDFSCTVDTTSFSGFVKCPCCGSLYALDESGGYVAQGPARYPLKQYNAIVDGGFLHIYN
ncbi:MAG TPA: hypothetical protein VE870_14885 [Bacteroidales bacterium]|nr:hypothetical protein [Bacteroidales bacterium]